VDSSAAVAISRDESFTSEGRAIVRSESGATTSSSYGVAEHVGAAAVSAETVVARRQELAVQNIIPSELSEDEVLQQISPEKKDSVQAFEPVVEADALMFEQQETTAPQAEAMEASADQQQLVELHEKSSSEKSQESGDILSDTDLQADLGEMKAESRNVYDVIGECNGATGGTATSTVDVCIQPPSFDEDDERRLSMQEATEIASEFVTDLESKAIEKVQEMRKSHEDLCKEEATKVAKEFVKDLEPMAMALAEQISPIVEASSSAMLVESVTKSREKKVTTEFSAEISSDTDFKSELLEFREELKERQELVHVETQKLVHIETTAQSAQVSGRLKEDSKQDEKEEDEEKPDEPKEDKTPFLGCRVESSRLQTDEFEAENTLRTSSTTYIRQTESSADAPKDAANEGLISSQSKGQMQLSAHSEDIWAEEAKVVLRKDVPSHKEKTRSDNESTSKSTTTTVPTGSAADRRSGTDFDLSSSGDNYCTAGEGTTTTSGGTHSGHSRPSSSDVEQMFSAMSGRDSSSNLTTTEYETAHSSRDVSTLSTTSQEFFTAESTMTSKSMGGGGISESSSGNLGSIEISDRTEDISGADTLLDAVLEPDRDMITPTGPPVEDFMSGDIQAPPGCILLSSETDTDEQSTGVAPSMKRSQEMMFQQREEQMLEDEDVAQEPMEALSQNLSGSVLTISSGSDATIIIAAEKKQQAEAAIVIIHQKEKDDVDLNRYDSTSSSISQPAIMSTTPKTGSADVLSSVEELTKDVKDVEDVEDLKDVEDVKDVKDAVLLPRMVSFDQAANVSIDIPEWKVQKSFDSEFGSRPESELRNLESRPQSFSEAMLSRSDSEEPRPLSKDDAAEKKLQDPFARPETPEPTEYSEEAMAEKTFHQHFTPVMDDVFERHEVGIVPEVEFMQLPSVRPKMGQSTLEERSSGPFGVHRGSSGSLGSSGKAEEEVCVGSPPMVSKPLGGVKYWPPSDDLNREDDSAIPIEKVQMGEEDEDKKWIESQFDKKEAKEVVEEEEEFFYSQPLDQIAEEEEEEQQDRDLARLKQSIKNAPELEMSARGPPSHRLQQQHEDIISMSSLQEFEKLESATLDAGSRGSQDSLEEGPFKATKKFVAKTAAGDTISVDSFASLKEFESLEQACTDAAKVEKKAKEQEDVLSEIDEGHESHSESADTISLDQKSEDDENSDDFEERMFQIDEIIKQAQTNVEQFQSEESDSSAMPKPEMLQLEDIIGRSDSRTESTGADKTPSVGTPDSDSLEAPQLPCLPQEPLIEDPMQTSVDSLELNKRQVMFEDVMQTSADSLELNKPSTAAAATMTLSTDSIEPSSSGKTLTGGCSSAAATDLMTDSLEGNGKGAILLGEASSHLGNLMTDSLEGNGKGAILDAVGNGARLKRPVAPPRLMQASTDSLEESCSNHTRATASSMTASSMASSGTSETMVADLEHDTTTASKRPSHLLQPISDTSDDNSGASQHKETTVDFTHGGQVSIGHSVTEVIRASREDYGHVVERTVEQSADISRVVFHGRNSACKMQEYVEERLGECETLQETEYTDAKGAIVRKKVVQQTRLVDAGVDEETVEEYDEWGNVTKFVLRSSVVEEPIEVVKTVELISETPKKKEKKSAEDANTADTAAVVVGRGGGAVAGATAASTASSRTVRQISGIFGCTEDIQHQQQSSFLHSTHTASYPVIV
jgi:hypothetical protein